MRIVLCNNFVRFASGVDTVVRAETLCLEGQGAEVIPLSRDNADLDRAGPFKKGDVAELFKFNVFS